MIRLRILAPVLVAFWFAPSSHVAAQIHDPRALDVDPGRATRPIAPRLSGLGDHRFAVTTTNADSQSFFDQGLRLTYGFNHSEALRAFKEAVRLDADNAMAHWGWALVLGPNLNLPMMSDVTEQAFAAVRIAMSLREKVSERERAYIEALATRYSSDPEADRAALDQAYADSMGQLVERYPGDADAATLYAAALMNLSPWEYWDMEGQPGPATDVLLAQLERALALDPEHPGALHYYIHAVEAADPRRAEQAADRLLPLMPGAGHLVHMPAHIYMRVGRYSDSYAANYLASLADEGYIAQCRAQGIYPLGYYPHNLHFLVWSAMFLGRREAALSAARKVAEEVMPGLEDDAGGPVEIFLTQPLYVMVRFGLWDAILAEPRPPDAATFWTGVWHYARVLAHAGTGHSRRASRELRDLRALIESDALAEYETGFAPASVLLTIATEIANGEVDRVRARHSEALAHFERATRLEDTLLYNEPPDWYFPVRHYLGAALLDAGYPTEAEVIYWNDLRKNPANGYSLLGLAQSLEALGRSEEADLMRERYQSAWSEADVALGSSRF